MRKPREMYIIKYWHFHGQSHPMLRFALSHNGQTTIVEAYVDSGAAFSLFSPDEAERLGIDYNSGRLRWVRGAGGVFIPAYLHRLRIIIGRFSFKATVGFSERIGVGFNLLGRKDVFSRLSFTFNDKYNFLLITNATGAPTSVKERLGLTAG